MSIRTMMSFSEAKELLLLHSYGEPNTDHPTQISGFLGSLRPYQGLNEGNFHAVMEAITALAPYFQQKMLVDKEIISALWAICSLGRAWGVEPEGMLRRNRLITDQGAKRLAQWVECISWAVSTLLGGSDLDTALEPYRAYCRAE